MDIIVPAEGELRDASINAYRNKGLLIDVTYAEPKRQVTFSAGAQPPTAQPPLPPKRAEACTILVHAMRLATSASTLLSPRWKTLGVSANVDKNSSTRCDKYDGGRGWWGLRQERILLRVISATTQVAIFRRVQRYGLALHGRQEVFDLLATSYTGNGHDPRYNTSKSQDILRRSTAIYNDEYELHTTGAGHSRSGQQVATLIKGTPTSSST